MIQKFSTLLTFIAMLLCGCASTPTNHRELPGTHLLGGHTTSDFMSMTCVELAGAFHSSGYISHLRAVARTKSLLFASPEGFSKLFRVALNRKECGIPKLLCRQLIGAHPGPKSCVIDHNKIRMTVIYLQKQDGKRIPSVTAELYANGTIDVQSSLHKRLRTQQCKAVTGAEFPLAFNAAAAVLPSDEFSDSSKDAVARAVAAVKLPRGYSSVFRKWFSCRVAYYNPNTKVNFQEDSGVLTVIVSRLFTKDAHLTLIRLNVDNTTRI